MGLALSMKNNINYHKRLKNECVTIQTNTDLKVNFGIQNKAIT